MFGQQQRAPFGGTTSTFGFGTPTTTATTGFGASSFGRPAFGTPQQTTSFGTSSSTPFGAATSSGTSLFGSQPQQTSGGLFGQQQTQASTGFSQASTGFGSTSGGGLFGQTQQPATGQLTTGGLFGSTTTPGFGAQQSTQNRPFGFGQTTTSSTTTSGGLFGSTPSTAGGLFGASTGFGGAAGAVSGTTIKYEPLTGSDTMTRNGVSTNIRTRIEVISTMKEYENKSLEELRVEDYLANRKGPGQGTTLPGFGQAQQQQQQQQQQPGGQLGSTGLFGTTTSTSLFGTKPPENKSLFGTGTTAGFGGTTGGSLFGTTTTPAFGQPSTTASAGFSFAQNTQQKTSGFNFGATPTSTPSLFGSTPQQPQSAFGIGGGFPLGQNNPQQQNAGGLFGTQNKPGGGFLSNQTTGGGLFGNKPTGIAQPLGTGFGTTSTVAPFGTSTNTNTATGLFGQQNAQNKTGIFSNFGNNPGFGNTGLFGQNNNQPKPGGLNFAPFGAGSNMGQGLGTATGGGLFGTAPTNANISGTGLFNTNPGFLGQTNNLGAGGVGGSLYPDLGKLVRAMTEKPVFDIPIGGSKFAGSTDKTSVGSPGDQSNKATISSLKPTYVLSPSLVANNKPRPKPINKTTNQGNNRHWLFKGLEDPNEESSEDFLKPKKYPSVRKLNLKVFKKEESAPSSLRLGEDVTEGDMASPLTVPVSPLGDTTPLRVNAPSSHENSPTPDIIKAADSIKKAGETVTSLQAKRTTRIRDPTLDKMETLLEMWINDHSREPYGTKGLHKGTTSCYFEVQQEGLAHFLPLPGLCVAISPALKKYAASNNIANRFLLIIDNAPSHPRAMEDWADNIEVLFMPPNTTSLIQPINQTVIAAFKAYYQRRTMAQLVQALDNNPNITIRDYWHQYNKKGIDNITASWKEVDTKTMNATWSKVWSESTNNFTEFVPTSVINLRSDIVRLSHRAGFDEVDEDDVQELLDSHSQPLTNEELEDMLQQLVHHEEAEPPWRERMLTIDNLQEFFNKIESAIENIKEMDLNSARSGTAVHGVEKALGCYREILYWLQRDVKLRRHQSTLFSGHPPLPLHHLCHQCHQSQVMSISSSPLHHQELQPLHF
ncbi:hypothetical protein Pmani_004205 [Petrolisthes manimaculis]|uniref:Nuclear pore complex protein Nup98-Nup96 n=1 Tax=Petrolisthes manimaculis TaxID=1843537 RepID=A0AAE1UIS6_9EUCA|nr:hypothetical protein Pmani_004205 [Petrolisthes manimaculis]